MLQRQADQLLKIRSQPGRYCKTHALTDTHKAGSFLSKTALVHTDTPTHPPCPKNLKMHILFFIFIFALEY